MPRGYRDEDEEKPGFKVGQAEAIRNSGKALLCKLEDGKEEWFPLSQIHDDSEVYEVGGEGELVITQWWAVKTERTE